MVKYALFKERFYSLIIDLIFIAGLSFLIGLFCSSVSLFIPFLSYNFFKNFSAIICALIVIWLYFAIMESSKHQATIGKMVMNLKVTNLKGRRISFKTASLRFFTKILSFSLKLNSKGQFYHDKINNCLVVKE